MTANTQFSKQFLLLEVLKLTMVTSEILVAGGIFNDISNAHKTLRKLRDDGQIDFLEYHKHRTTQYFYYLRKERIKDHQYHRINESTLQHDTMTSIFLIKSLLSLRKKNVAISWRNPFSIGTKICDGGIVSYQNGNLLRSILIETDNNTHDQTEIIEKVESYLMFLDKPYRRILFLLPSVQRKVQVKQIVDEVTNKINPAYKNHIYFKIQ